MGVVQGGRHGYRPVGGVIGLAPGGPLPAPPRGEGSRCGGAVAGSNCGGALSVAAPLHHAGRGSPPIQLHDASPPPSGGRAREGAEAGRTTVRAEVGAESRRGVRLQPKPGGGSAPPSPSAAAPGAEPVAPPHPALPLEGGGFAPRAEQASRVSAWPVVSIGGPGGTPLVNPPPLEPHHPPPPRRKSSPLVGEGRVGGAAGRPGRRKGAIVVQTPTTTHAPPRAAPSLPSPPRGEGSRCGGAVAGSNCGGALSVAAPLHRAGRGSPPIQLHDASPPPSGGRVGRGRRALGADDARGRTAVTPTSLTPAPAALPCGGSAGRTAARPPAP